MALDTHRDPSVQTLSLAEQQTLSRHNDFDAMQHGALEHVHERDVPAGSSTVDTLFTSSIVAVAFF